MESTNDSRERCDQTVPGGEEEEEEDRSVRGIQSHYLRCPSPSFSTASESRFSLTSGSDAASIFMEPIHLSSAVAAKKIIGEELPPRSSRTPSVPESMLETAEQLMVEDLYNRVRDMMDDRSPYNTPCVLDLQRAMVQDRLEAPLSPVDEVWPNIFIAEKSVAVNKARLKRMGVTHILNSAHGTGVYTSEPFYAHMNIRYMGIEVDDFADADISGHFRPAAEFLDEALLTHKGRVLVVSVMGVSRSAVLVASYLMIFQHMSIMEALSTMRKKRAINPNEGFLKQLRDLNETLMEERDDDDETLSQCSVIDAHARAHIFDDGGEEDEQSMVGVKAQSIMMEEEEDGESVMSSAASSAALRSRLAAAQTQRDPAGVQQEGRSDADEEDGLIAMIHEWQQRNDKYQDDDWWEAQLCSDGEEEESPPQGRPEAKKDGADVDSVTSSDIRAVKEHLKGRSRRPPSDAASTSSCTTYSDLWRQRLKQIEQEAAARCRRKEQQDCSGSAAADPEGRRSVDAEVESILSDSASMYNFCQKNKERMTPLERWRIKRIQFGWNQAERQDGGGAGEGGAKTPSLRDVNLTAYQAWKLRQQRRVGEEDRDEILELGRGDDSAAIRRRQRREEVLERSKRTLEESQSLCGWEAESAISGATVPLSAFWAGATPQPSAASDDNMSLLSGRSSAISSVSQARSTRSAAVYPLTPVPPVPLVPAAPGHGAEPVVDLASIQSWIAAVVSETLKQKQGELTLPPPECAGSPLSFGGAASVASGRGGDLDRASRLSGASWSGPLPQGPGRAASVLSAGASSSVSGLTGLGPTKKRISTTSVPLFSLFQDQVSMGRLEALEKDIRSEMRGKMDTYEKKKILEDNRRSSRYKKKKAKEEVEEEEEERRRLEEDFLEETKRKEKPSRTYGLSGRLSLRPALEREQKTSIDAWLRSVRPPAGAGPGPAEDLYEDLGASASELHFCSRSEDEEDEGPSGLTSTYRPASHDDATSERQSSCNGFRRAVTSYGEGAENYGDLRHHWRSEDTQTERGGGRRQEAEEEDDIAIFIAQTRQRIRAQVAAEAEDDEALAAWRSRREAPGPAAAEGGS